MKSRRNIVLLAVLIMLGAIIFMVRGQKTIIVTAVAPPNLHLRPQGTPALVEQAHPAPRRALASSSVDAVPAPAPGSPGRAAGVTKVVNSDVGAKAGFTAAEGDTLSNVVAGLLGSDTKMNRDAVIAANPSLQADPDRVLAGKTYFVAAPRADFPPSSIPSTQPEASKVTPSNSDRVLTYTAQPGDTVSVLAGGLLGGDSKTNRDAIISQNQSLQRDPDRVVTGKTYKIPTTDGLAAAPTPAAANPPLGAAQSDADDVVRIGAGRQLRYTALAGDTVSNLAKILLGSDTQANRDAIINNNVTLKSDPDRVVAGQTYWIPAPAPSVEQR